MTTRRQLPALAAALLLAASAAATGGPDDSDAKTAPVFSEAIDVAGRAAASEAATVTVIDRARLESSGALTVGEALSLDGVLRLGSGSRGALVAMRGGGPNLTLVLLDGVPLNNHTEIEGGAVDVGALPLDLVERIEVVRGPLSFFLGSSPLSGMINIVTRRGSDAGPRVTAVLGGGSPDLSTASASYSRGDAGRDLLIAASWNRDDERLGDDAFEQLEVLANGGRRIGDHLSMRLSGRFASLTRQDYPEASGGPIYGNGELRDTDSTSLSFSSTLDYQPTARQYHGLSLAVARQERDRTSPFVPPSLPPSTESARFTKLRGGWIGRFDLDPALRLSAGVDVERDEGHNESLQLLPPQWGGPQPGDYDLARTTPGAFVELRHERGALLLEGGVRADLPEDRAAAWSPRLGARWRSPGSSLSWRASAGRSFKLPSFFVLGSPRSLGGNPDLLPERSTGVEVGVDLNLARGAAGVTLFRTVYDQMIDFDFPTFRFVNRATIVARGVELSAEGPLASTVSLRGDLTWQKVEDREDPDNEMLHEPAWRANALLLWQATRTVRLALAGRYVSGSYDSQLPVPQLDRVAAGNRFDLTLDWSATEQLTLRLRLENLADNTFETYIGFPEPGFNARLVAKWAVGPSR